MVAANAGMQQTIGNGRRLSRHTLAGGTLVKRHTESHGVDRGEGSRRSVVTSEKTGSIFRRTEKRSQLLGGVVVEPQIGRRKLFLQHSGIDKQAQGGAFHAIRRANQYFAFAFEVGAGHSSVNRLSKADDAVVEPDVYVFALDDGFADLEHTFEDRVQRCAKRGTAAPQAPRSAEWPVAERPYRGNTGQTTHTTKTRRRDGPDCHEAELKDATKDRYLSS